MNNPKRSLSACILLAAGLHLSLLTASSQPVSWTSYHNGSRPNILGLDPTTGTRDLSYSPLNNDIYVLGKEYYSLPLAPSPYAVGTEVVIERFDRLTGSVVSTLHLTNHSASDSIPHNDIPGKMVIAPDGSIYITISYFYDSFYKNDMAVIKFNSSLVEQWRNYFWGPGSSMDAGMDIALDGTGNIYVVGQIGDNGSTGSDWMTAKMDPSGTLLWSYTYNSNGSNDDTPVDMVLDNKKQLLVTGYSHSVTNGNQYLTVKFSDSGLDKWKKTYNAATGTGSDQANSVAVDNTSGKVVVTGTSTNAQGNSDISTICYDSTGTQLWVRKINQPGNSSDHGFKVLINAAHRVFVGGDVDRDSTLSVTGELLVRKYDLAGNTLLTKKYHGASYDCEFGDLALAPSGSFYVTGACYGAVTPPGTGYSLVTLKYSSAGALSWTDLLSPPQFQSCGEGYYGWKLALSSNLSELAVGGRHFVDCPGTNSEEWVTRRYTPSSLRTPESDMAGTSEAEHTIRIHPVPARDMLTMTLNEEPGTSYMLIIYNLTGQQVKTMTCNRKEESVEIRELPSGTYFLSVQTDRYRKMTRFVKQ